MFHISYSIKINTYRLIKQINKIEVISCSWEQIY